MVTACRVIQLLWSLFVFQSEAFENSICCRWNSTICFTGQRHQPKQILSYGYYTKYIHSWSGERVWITMRFVASGTESLRTCHMLPAKNIHLDKISCQAKVFNYQKRIQFAGLWMSVCILFGAVCLSGPGSVSDYMTIYIVADLRLLNFHSERITIFSSNIFRIPYSVFPYFWSRSTGRTSIPSYHLLTSFSCSYLSSMAQPSGHTVKQLSPPVADLQDTYWKV
jgi:hypothetical protein